MVDNKYQNFLRKIFNIQKMEIVKKSEDELPNELLTTNYLDILKKHSLVYKMTQVYWHSLTLFEFIHFKVMANIKPIDLIDM